jgi:hypothetical protein
MVRTVFAVAVAGLVFAAVSGVSQADTATPTHAYVPTHHYRPTHAYRPTHRPTHAPT